MPKRFRSFRKFVSPRTVMCVSRGAIPHDRRKAHDHQDGSSVRVRHTFLPCERLSTSYAERSSFSLQLSDRRRQTMTQKERVKAEDRRTDETFVISEVEDGYRIYAPADGKRTYLVRPDG